MRTFRSGVYNPRPIRRRRRFAEDVYEDPSEAGDMVEAGADDRTEGPAELEEESPFVDETKMSRRRKRYSRPRFSRNGRSYMRRGRPFDDDELDAEVVLEGDEEMVDEEEMEEDEINDGVVEPTSEVINSSVRRRFNRNRRNVRGSHSFSKKEYLDFLLGGNK